jgi:hypothetical protein
VSAFTRARHVYEKVAFVHEGTKRRLALGANGFTRTAWRFLPRSGGVMEVARVKCDRMRLDLSRSTRGSRNGAEPAFLAPHDEKSLDLESSRLSAVLP